MTTISSEQKKHLILEYEREFATRLAVKVLDKPKPPLWMIFIPIFFVFFAQKMSQYKAGLADFVENHLKARRRALNKALEVREGGGMIDAASLEDMAATIPDAAKAPYLRWMSVLVEHYVELLSARGESFKGLIRTGYQSKTNYLLLCNNLNTAEKAYNQALLPGLDGDAQDLRAVVERMDVWVVELRRQDANGFFS